MSFITGKKSILSISSNHILTDNDNINIVEINSSGSTVSLTLPSAANNKGRNILAKVVSHSNLVTITGTIDGETNFYMNNAKDFISVYSNGTEWKKDRFQASYETNYINRSDWTNVYPGTNTTKNVNSYITHNLQQNLNNLEITFFISTDGTENNSFEISRFFYYLPTAVAGTEIIAGITNYQIDTNNLRVQIGTAGLPQVTTSGLLNAIDSEDWFYKIVVKRKK